MELVELRNQAFAIPLDEAVRLDAGLLSVEAQVGPQPCHANLDAGSGNQMIGIDLTESRLVPDLVRQQNHVDVVAMAQRQYALCSWRGDIQGPVAVDDGEDTASP